MPELKDGISVTIGGKEYILPPLKFLAAKKVLPLLEGLATRGPEDAMEDLFTILHLGLMRNYPEISRDQIEQEMESSEFFDITENKIPQFIVMSGLDFKKKRIDKALAEAELARRSIGDGSTAT